MSVMCHKITRQRRTDRATWEEVAHEAHEPRGAGVTAVVLVGDFPDTGIIRATPAQRVPLSGVSDFPAFLDLVAYGLRERQAIVVLCPSWRSAETVRAVRLARSVLYTDRIACLPLNLPPLAVSLIADQLAFTAAYVRPGALAGLAHRLAAEIHAGAWVNSVARLERVATGFGQHLSSYLPGSGFMVAAAPRQLVHRITSARPIPEIGARPADPVLMMLAHEGGDLGWVERELRPALGAVSVTKVPVQPLSHEYWGTKKYAEFVAFSGHPLALEALIRATPFHQCSWCGEPSHVPVCVFCAMTHDPAQHAGPGTAPPQPAPDARVPPPSQPQPQQGPPVQSHFIQPQSRQGPAAQPSMPPSTASGTRGNAPTPGSMPASGGQGMPPPAPAPPQSHTPPKWPNNAQNPPSRDAAQHPPRDVLLPEAGFSMPSGTYGAVPRLDTGVSIAQAAHGASKTHHRNG